MGKKDYIMDNGKKAQSSMTLYWKSNKQRQKHPKQKKQHKQQDGNQISDKRVMSNFQKWKMHKQKIITKAYTQQSKQQTNKKIDQKQQNNDKDNQYEMYQQMMQKKMKPKAMNIPGFKSKSNLKAKIQLEQPQKADQSTNILKLPDHMSDMTQEDILRILRQKKNKKDLINRHHQNQTKIKKQNDGDEEDVLLGEEFIDLMRIGQKKAKQAKQKEEELQKQRLRQIAIEKQAQVTYFKSDILKKMEREGIQKILQEQIKTKKGQVEVSLEKEIRTTQVQGQVNNYQSTEKSQNIVEKDGSSTQFNIHNFQPKFIPRVLKK